MLLELITFPIFTKGSEETTKMITGGYKEATLVSGATKLNAGSMKTSSVTLGIATSAKPGLARVAGETAATVSVCRILLTSGLTKASLEPVMALTYDLCARIWTIEQTPDRVSGGTLTLFFNITFITFYAIVLRTYYGRKQPWLKWK